MTISEVTTREELGAIICEALGKALGDSAVLVGGAVAAIYTEGRFLSDDLDFVSWRSEKERQPVLEQLGFRKNGRYWVHPRTTLFIEFVNTPVMVGKKFINKYSSIQTAVGTLTILSPLDCALDRLCWFMDRHDSQTLEQAVDVIVTHGISLDDIEAWIENEEYRKDHKTRAIAELKRKVDERKTS